MVTTISAAMRAAHKLSFDGNSERNLMGRCKCGEVILQGLGHGTARQQIRAAHAKHLTNVAHAAWVSAGCPSEAAS